MACKGCGQRIVAQQDPYLGRLVRLKDGKEGEIYTRLAGDRTTYGLKTATGETIWFKVASIDKLLPRS